MRHPSLLLPAIAASVLVTVSACGDSVTPVPGETSAPAPSTVVGEPAETRAGGGLPDVTPALDFQDQVGAGDGVLVAQVALPSAGFVVISTGDGTVLGAGAVPEGAEMDLQVPLDPPLTDDTTVTATLHADTDGNGEFDPAVDQPVAASPDDEGLEDQVVSTEADYDVR